MSAPASPPPALRERWEHDARAAIAAVHDGRTRAKELDGFEKLVVTLPKPTHATDAQTLRVAAAHELASPGKYQLGAVHPPEKSWLERAWEWIVKKADDVLHPVFSRLHIGRNGAQGISFAMLVLLALGLAFVLARILRLIGFVREERLAYVTPLEAQRNAHALMLEAGNLATAGRYTEAVRVLFRAAVTLLDLRGAITDDAAATVNELQRELAARSAAAVPPFSTIAASFTHAAYAERPMTNEDWAEARSAYDRLNAAVTG